MEFKIRVRQTFDYPKNTPFLGRVLIFFFFLVFSIFFLIMTTPKNKRKADDNVNNDSSIKKRTTVEPKAIDQEEVEIHRTYLKTNNTNNIYQNAKSIFRRTAVPSRLVGRGEERERMSEFYRDHVLSN
ncbi:unnamed protein product [Rhizopus stolonifer]